MTTATAPAGLSIGNTSYDDLDTYRAEVHSKISRKASALSTISPLALLGFIVGQPLNFKPYDKLGFNHPRNSNYYKLEFDAEGNVTNGNPNMIEKFEGIRRSGKIDDPILVYPLNRVDGNTEILVLDGATRLSAIAYIQAQNPSAFVRIPINVFSGTEVEAMAEMVRRNLEDYSTALDDVDLMRSIKFFVNAGWTKDEISERLGKDPVKWRATLDNYINAGEKLIPALVNAWSEGKLTRSAAFEAAKAPEEEQEAVAEQVASGEKVKGSDIKKRNAEKREMRPNRTLTTLAEKFSPESTGEKASQLAGFLASKRLKSKYADRLKEIHDSIIALRDDIDADINPPAENEGEE